MLRLDIKNKPCTILYLSYKTKTMAVEGLSKKSGKRPEIYTFSHMSFTLFSYHILKTWHNFHFLHHGPTAYVLLCESKARSPQNCFSEVLLKVTFIYDCLLCIEADRSSQASREDLTEQEGDTPG
jgi:hypothetical protein